MTWLPENDGVDHINVYSQGKTALGRTLSNFAHTPFRIPLWGKFESVEGFWFWRKTGLPAFRQIWGHSAKKLGGIMNNDKEITERELTIAYRAKLKAHPYIREALRQNKLPLAHYYVYNGVVKEPQKYQWTAQLWNKLVKRD